MAPENMPQTSDVGPRATQDIGLLAKPDWLMVPTTANDIIGM